MLLSHAMIYLKGTKDLKLQYSPLDIISLKLYVFANCGYNTNGALTTQSGIVIFFVDDISHCHVLYWESYRGQHVTKSVLVMEAYAFSESYDYIVGEVMIVRSMKTNIPLYV